MLRDSSPPGEKLCYPPWMGAGSVPVIASAQTRQLDPRQRAQTRPSDQMIEPHPVGAALNRTGEQATITVSTEPGSRDLGRRPPMGETRLPGTSTAIQTQTPAQPMRVQYDLASGQSFLTPIRGEDAPRYPILTQCIIAPKLRRKGPCRGFYQRAVVTPGGGGSYTHLPPGDSLGNPRLQSPHCTHQDDYRGGARSIGANPFSC